MWVVQTVRYNCPQRIIFLGRWEGFCWVTKFLGEGLLAAPNKPAAATTNVSVLSENRICHSLDWISPGHSLFWNLNLNAYSRQEACHPFCVTPNVTACIPLHQLPAPPPPTLSQIWTGSWRKRLANITFHLLGQMEISRFCFTRQDLQLHSTDIKNVKGLFLKKTKFLRIELSKNKQK